MANTWSWLATYCRTQSLQDGLAHLYNGAADCRDLLEVKRVHVLPVEAPVVAGGPGALDLVRITATSGGTAQAAVKHDPASADLPSQVTVTTRPTSITSTGIVLRRMRNVPATSVAVAGGPVASRIGAGLQQPKSAQKAALLTASDDTNGITGLVLREAEGIAIRQAIDPGVGTSQLAMILFTTAGGAAYSYLVGFTTGSVEAEPIVSIFNATGSGVVLTVRVILLPERGAGDILPGLRLTKTRHRKDDGIDIATGTAIAHDPGNPALPAGVELRAGPFLSESLGDRIGVPMDWPYTHGTSGLSVALQQTVGTIRALTRSLLERGPAGAVTQLLQPYVLYDAQRSADQGIKLRQGEGCAVLDGRAGDIAFSELHAWNIEYVFTHTPSGAGPAPVYPGIGTWGIGQARKHAGG